MSVFVLAFLCFNFGGALCLTACTQFFAAETTTANDAHLSEHCKQAKKAAEERDRDSTKIEAGEASCCMMPVGLFAAPVEKRPDLKITSTAVALPATIRYEFVTPAFHSASPSAMPVYRPPPLDQRPQRILHSVFRI